MNAKQVPVSFPVAFPSRCLNVIGVATRANDSDGKSPGYDCENITVKGFTCTNGTNHLTNLTMRYWSVGV